MNLKKSLSRFFVKASILSLLVCLVFMDRTSSQFIDVETSEGNTLETGTLDLGLRSDTDFVPNGTSMEPGDVVTREIYFQNLGNNPFDYKGSYQYLSGDEDLCNALRLRVLYNGSVVKYSGFLKDFNDFDTNIPTHDPDLILLPGNEQLFVYEITLPSGTGYLLDKSCTFNFGGKAWQQGIDESLSGFWDEEVIENTIATQRRCEEGKEAVEVAPIDKVNIGDSLSESLHDIDGWSSPNLSGNYGGKDDGTYRQIIEENSCNEDGREAKFVLYAGNRKAQLLRIRALDGLSNLDSFEVYVNDELVGSYTDVQDSQELWHDFAVPLDNLSGRLEVKLKAINEIWSQCNTYGQVAISWAEIEGYYCSPDEAIIPEPTNPTCEEPDNPVIFDPLENLDIGDPVSEATHSMIGWSSANLPGNYGGKDDGTYRQVISEQYCSDEYRVAGFTFDTGEKIANILRLRVLDGISLLDGLDVYINDVFTAHLPDLTPTSSEVWKTYEIGLPNLSGEVKIRLVATDEIWNSCSVYGQVSLSWAQLSGYSCNDEPQPIVLNEILYNPSGSDNAPMPGGEWVELYNNSDTAVDVAGWRIQEGDGSSITIANTNSDNDLDTGDGGETVVPAHSWLVVYRNADGTFILNNSSPDGDTVSLYNNSDVLIDSHTYGGGKPAGNSEARSPDGTGAWVDPLPTPGRKNVASPSDLEPQVKLWQQDEENLKIGIFDALNYKQANYTIIYTHQELAMPEPQQEALTGSVTIDGLEELVKDLYLGTCSRGICVPHTKVEDVNLTVVLSGNGIPERTLGTNL